MSKTEDFLKSCKQLLSRAWVAEELGAYIGETPSNFLENVIVMMPPSPPFWKSLSKQAFDEFLANAGDDGSASYRLRLKKLQDEKRGLFGTDGVVGSMEVDVAPPKAMRRGSHPLPDRPIVLPLLAILGLARGISTPSQLRGMLDVGCLTVFRFSGADSEDPDVPKAIQTSMEFWAEKVLKMRNGADVRVKVSPSGSSGKASPSANSVRNFATSVVAKLQTGCPTVVVCRSFSDMDNELTQLANYRIEARPIDEDGLLSLIRLLHRPAEGLPDSKILESLPSQALASLSATRLEIALRQRTFAKFVKNLSSARAPAVAPRDEVTLADVHGQPKAVAAFKAMSDDLQRWRSGSLAWSDGVFTAVMYGPPGNGKTMLASAFAGSAGIPQVFTSYAECQSSGHQGDMLKALKTAFNTAIEQSPCLLFIDEIDSFSQRGEGQNEQYMRGVVNGLLTEITRAVDAEGVVLLAATNHLSTVDTAVIRPGRFDLRIPVMDPTIEGLCAILAHHLGDVASRVDSKQILACARQMVGLSGAAVAALARQALAIARQEKRDFEIEDLQRILVPSNIEEEMSLMNRIAIHEAGHAVVRSLTALPKPAKIGLGRNGGYVMSPSVQYHTVESAMDELCVLMAGRVAERVCLGSVSSGSGKGVDSDLALATRFAIQIETEWHLQSTKPLWQSSDVLMTVGMSAELKRRVLKLLKQAEARALEVVERHKAEVLDLAAELVEKREIIL